MKPENEILVSALIAADVVLAIYVVVRAATLQFLTFEIAQAILGW